MSYIIENDYLTVKEVAQILKLSELTIYKYIRAQMLEAFEFGKHFRIPRSSLEKFIQAHRIVAKEPSVSEIPEGETVHE